MSTYFGQNFLFHPLPSKMECLISSLYLAPQNYFKNINLVCFCFGVYMNVVLHVFVYVYICLYLISMDIDNTLFINGDYFM